MDDGGVREEVCCYSAVDTDVFCWEVILIAYCRDQLTTNPWHAVDAYCHHTHLTESRTLLLSWTIAHWSRMQGVFRGGVSQFCHLWHNLDATQMTNWLCGAGCEWGMGQSGCSCASPTMACRSYQPLCSRLLLIPSYLIQLDVSLAGGAAAVWVAARGLQTVSSMLCHCAVSCDLSPAVLSQIKIFLEITCTCIVYRNLWRQYLLSPINGQSLTVPTF